MQLPKPGDVFAERYLIERVLGSGGFALVFAALDRESMSNVALKILRPDAADGYDADVRVRFAREVQIVAQLRDPHTVQLFASGEHAGVLWAAFEQVPGRDLAGLLNHVGRLDAPRASHVVHQVLQSLREAHNRGLIHRDLKPENVRVFDGPEGPLTVKVLDFGIARSTESGHPSVTKTGALIGTPRYMSPEQLRGEALTPASDIYSVGLLGYELLAGRDALSGNSVIDQVERLTPEYEYVVAGADPAAQRLLSILGRMLEPDLSKRLRTADAAIAALENREPEVLPRPSSGPNRKPNRKPIAFGALVLVLVAAIAGIAFITINNADRPPDPVPATRSNPLVKTEQRLAEAIVDSVEEEPEEPSDNCHKGAFSGLVKHLGAASYVYTPEGFRGAAASGVVLLFASGSSVAQKPFFEYTGFKAVADRENLLVIVPPAKLVKMRNSGRVTSWEEDAIDGAWSALNRVAQMFCVPGRVPAFVLGEHIGARAVDTLLADYGSQITAAATTAGRYQKIESITWGKKHMRRDDNYRPVAPGNTPLLDFSHKKDGFLPYGGGTNIAGDHGYLSVAERNARLTAAHGCKGRKLREADVDNGECWSLDCDVPLKLCEVEGREWQPNAAWTSPETGGYSGFDYTGVTWKFFDDQRKRLPIPRCDEGPRTGRIRLGEGRSQRDVFHYAPAVALDKPTRILVVMRQAGKLLLTPEKYWNYLGFQELADRENLIVVMPETLVSSPDDWEADELGYAWDDVLAIRKLYCLPSSTPVLLFGESRGAVAADRLAMLHPTEITAMAVSSLRYRKEANVPEIKGVPYLDFSHTQDLRTPYDGKPAGKNPAMQSAPERFAHLREASECSGEALPVSVAGPGKCETWTCKSPLQICEVDGGQWLSDRTTWLLAPREIAGGPFTGFPYADAMWTFFAKQLPEEVPR